MAHPMKIATCSYCGTRAALVLDKSRHELACGACGAPLHDIKMMPKSVGSEQKPNKSSRPKSAKPMKKRKYEPEYSYRKPKKQKKRRRWGREMLEEIWDVVEDIFD